MTVATEIRDNPAAALSLSQAAELFPSGNDDPVCRATVVNWAKTGVVADGRRVKLGTAKVGGKRFTTLAAIARFIEEQNGIPGGPATSAPAPVTAA